MIFAYRSSILWSFIFKRRSLFRSYKIFVFLSPAFYLTWALIWWLHTELRAIVGPAYPVPSLFGIDITVVKEDLYIDTRVCVHTHTRVQHRTFPCADVVLTAEKLQHNLVWDRERVFLVTENPFEAEMHLCNPLLKVEHLRCHVSFDVVFSLRGGNRLLLLYLSSRITKLCYLTAENT